MNRCSLLADAVVAVHVGYVAFVGLGLVFILIGRALNWRWVRNRWFRVAHLAAIAIVVCEAWLQITCPLTTLEDWLRRQAGQSVAEGSFVGRWLHDLLFLEAPPWAFSAGYTVFGVAVVLAWLWAPPGRGTTA